jgi:hypothetical protein
MTRLLDQIKQSNTTVTQMLTDLSDEIKLWIDTAPLGLFSFLGIQEELEEVCDVFEKSFFFFFLSFTNIYSVFFPFNFHKKQNKNMIIF